MLDTNAASITLNHNQRNWTIVMLRTLSFASVLACISTLSNAHEFWIDPEEHLVAHLRVGELYKGSSYSFLPPRFQRFDYAFDGEIRPVEGTMGDRPAVTMVPPGEGLITLVHVTTNSRITWKEFEKFESFVRHKDAVWTLEAHEARGLPKENVTEIYSRYAKSLVAVGSGEGTDIEAGLLTEKDAAGEVVVSLVRTDEDGIASIPVKPGHRYMLDAVVLRDGGDEAQWESLWANLTFAVPGN